MVVHHFHIIGVQAGSGQVQVGERVGSVQGGSARIPALRCSGDSKQPAVDIRVGYRTPFELPPGHGPNPAGQRQLAPLFGPSSLVPRAASLSQAALISWRLALICSGVEELPVAIAHCAPAA